jgi:hypothetical protein
MTVDNGNRIPPSEDHFEREAMRLSMVRESFVKTSLPKHEVWNLLKNGNFSLRTDCVDERAENPPLIGKGIYIGELSLPGGGFDALTEERIGQILEMSTNVELVAHRFCGWSASRMTFYEGIKDKISESIAGTTMVIPDNMVFQNGKHYVDYIVNNAFNNEAFVTEITRLYPELMSESGNTQAAKLNTEIRTFAFAYGKMLELKGIFDEINERNNYGSTISVKADSFDDAPEDHVAQAIVVNMTDRIRVERFEVEGLEYPKPFFVDIDDVYALPPLASFLRGIMLGHHSKTAQLQQEIHVFCNDENHQKEIANFFSIEGENIKVYYHIVAENE